MVIPADDNKNAPSAKNDRDFNFMAAIVPERSNPSGGSSASTSTCNGSLSDFSSLPSFNLTWGRKRKLICVKPADDDEDLPTSSSYRRRSDFDSNHRRRLADEDDNGGRFEATRKKIMLDLRTEVDQVQAGFLKHNNGDKPDVAPAAGPELRPWNLRTRRAVCKEPNNNSVKRPSFSPARCSDVKSPMKSIYGGGAVACEEKGPRAKFSVSLSKAEIEEDFLAMAGTRPARRPKKRPRCVQKEIDAVFPGLWLSEITADMYKVNEQPLEGAKR